MNSKSANVIEVTINYSIMDLLTDAEIYDLYIDTTGDIPAIRTDSFHIFRNDGLSQVLIIPPAMSLCKEGTIMAMFYAEHGLGFYHRPSLSLLEEDLLEEYSDYRESVLTHLFDLWCEENNVRILVDD